MTEPPIFSNAEQLEVIIIWVQQQFSYSSTAQVFNTRYPDRHPCTARQIRAVLERLRAFGVCQATHHRPPNRGLSQATLDTVRGIYGQRNKISTRQAARESGISRTQIQRALHQLKYFPYKITYTQKLLPRDFTARTEFAERTLANIDANPDFLQNIVFTDECLFKTNGQVNRQNLRFWCKQSDRPVWISQRKKQTVHGVNVFCAMFRGNIIGPFTFEGGRNNQESYRRLLEDEIFPRLRLLNDGTLDNIYWQQDGAPSHRAGNTLNFLRNHFGDRIISTRTEYPWPPRSPDLTELDFFLWGYLKHVVYQTMVDTAEALLERIDEACRTLETTKPETFDSVRREFQERLRLLLLVNGRHVEKFVKRARSAGLLEPGRYEEALREVRATGQIPNELGELIDDDEIDDEVGNSDDDVEAYEEEVDDDEFTLYVPNQPNAIQIENAMPDQFNTEPMNFDVEPIEQPPMTQPTQQILSVDRFKFNPKVIVTPNITDNTPEENERVRLSVPRHSNVNTTLGAFYKSRFSSNPLVIVSDEENQNGSDINAMPETSRASIQLLNQENAECPLSSTTIFFQRQKENQRRKILLEKCTIFFKNNRSVLTSTLGSNETELIWLQSNEKNETTENSLLTETQKMWEERCRENVRMFFNPVVDNYESDSD